MPQSMVEFINWALDTFGIKIHTHQLDRIQTEIKKYINEKQVKKDELLNSVRHKKNPYYNDLVNIITVQESYFFRDQSLFLYLKNHYFPALLSRKKKNKDHSIRIWSAGSSMGEELYSLAMLLNELSSTDEHWYPYLLGTDINAHALKVARTGEYRRHAMRATTTYYREKFFQKKDNFLYLKSEVKKNTLFKEHNLNSPLPPDNIPFDLILCRNALIYLEDKAISNALSLFEQSLNDDGCLFLGPSDLITYQAHGFTMHQDLSIFYFAKGKTPNEKPITINKPQLEPSEQPSFIDRIRSRATDFNQIKQLISDKDYEKALVLINPLLEAKEDSVLLHRYKAQALIGLGDNVTALESLKKAAKLDPKDPKTHYFMGLCYVEEGHSNLALNAFNQALSLKSAFPEANHALALLLLNDKQLEKGIKTLIVAHKQARKCDAETKVLASDETMLGLANIIEKEISYYKDFFNE